MTYIDQEFNKFISKVKISSLLLIFEHFAFYKSDHVIVIVITYFNQAFWTDYSDLKKLLIKIIKNRESDSSQNGSIFFEVPQRTDGYAMVSKLNPSSYQLTISRGGGPWRPLCGKKIVNFGHFLTQKMQFSHAYAIMTHSNSQWVCNY